MDLIEELGSDLVDVQSTRLPSCKSINQPIAGLFVAFDSMKLAEWREDAYEVGSPHALQTNSEDLLTGKMKTVPGRLFPEPRLLIVRGQYVSVDKATRYCLGQWVVNKSMANEDRPDECYKRYLIYFLDPNGLMYHKNPIQLSANKTFLSKFETNLRECLTKHFIKTNKPFTGKEVYVQDDISKKSWYAANCIFQPKFISKMAVKEKSKAAPACQIESYADPLPFKATSLWYKNEIFEKTVGWWKKSVDKKLLPPSIETSPAAPEPEEVVFEDVFP
jgi:hypothetical protein